MKHKTEPGVHHGRVTAALERIHERHKALRAAPAEAVAAAAAERALLTPPPTPPEAAQ